MDLPRRIQMHADLGLHPGEGHRDPLLADEEGLGRELIDDPFKRRIIRDGSAGHLGRPAPGERQSPRRVASDLIEKPQNVLFGDPGQPDEGLKVLALRQQVDHPGDHLGRPVRGRAQGHPCRDRKSAAKAEPLRRIGHARPQGAGHQICDRAGLEPDAHGQSFSGGKSASGGRPRSSIPLCDWSAWLWSKG